MINSKIALITGAGSMDGRTLTHLLLSKNYHVILTFRRNTQLDINNIYALFKEDLFNYPNSRLDFEVCDITDKNSVEECVKNVLNKYSKIDELYMIAAMSHVGYSFTQKDYCISANGQSYYYFLEVIKNHSKNTRVYGSLTSELAGNVPDGTVFNEESAWAPRSPYSISKNLAGNWIKFYRESKDSNLFACFGILFNHSNIYRSMDFYSRKCTNSAAKIALGKQSQLFLGDIFFYRDEHWSDFGCEMMWKMLQNSNPIDYVIGNGECHSGEEFLNISFNYFNLDWRKYVKLDESLLRPNEVHRLISDPSKAEAELGWRRNRMSFKQHIELMCKFDHELESGQTPVRPDVFKMFP